MVAYRNANHPDTRSRTNACIAYPRLGEYFTGNRVNLQGLHEHLSKTKVPLRVLVRARRGEAFATAVGNATIGLDKLAAYVSGTPGSGSKTSIMIPIEIPPLGSMVIRMSMGLSCLASMEGDSTFVDEHLSVTRTINNKVSSKNFNFK